jgi:peptidoglycan/LPS O-acetylase OafA/YrhL
VASIPNRKADIQVLRGIAVSAVFIQHYASWFPIDGEGSSLKLNFFWIGVDLFFVISGFLIVTKLLECDRSSPWSELKTFWKARFRRLLPAAVFWSFIAGLVSIGTVWLDQTSPLQVGSATLASFTGVSNFYWWACANEQISQAVCVGKGPYGVYWSLSLEEQFYLLASILLVFGFRKAFLIILFSACVWNLTTEWTVPWAFGWVLRPYGLAVGSLLAFGCHNWPSLASKSLAIPDRLAIGVISLCLIALLAIFYHPAATFFASLCCGLLLWIARMDGCFSKTPFGVALEYLGERSYSFYLCHVAIIITVRDLMIRFLDDDSHFLMSSWVVCGLTFGLSLLFSHLSYMHIENRFRLSPGHSRNEKALRR